MIFLSNLTETLYQEGAQTKGLVFHQLQWRPSPMCMWGVQAPL